MTELLGSNLNGLVNAIALPAPATSLSSNSAFDTPVHQPGLIAAPPSPEDWIRPTRPPLDPNPQQRSKKPWSSIPSSAFGTPLRPLPIITTDPSADTRHANGQPNRGYKQSFKHHSDAVSHILAHYASHGFPPDMCTNCFTYHPGHPCASPPYEWSSLLGRHHPRCPVCQEMHFPPCTPPSPSLPASLQ